MPLCDWHDDIVQNDDPDLAGGANKLSLNEYRTRWEAEHHRVDVETGGEIGAT
ncbi:MAG: hypothetical protein LBK59_02300 [Bifidobacteriaceae bacterium]|nr:hypothetical protein [Bifidobacteriaceae bacterium]